MNKTVLHNCGRLEVRSSPIEGYGVFATDKINKDEILEEVPFVLFPRYTPLGKTLYDSLRASNWTNPKEEYLENLRENLGFKEPEKYLFKWYPSSKLDGESNPYTVLPLGNGPIYNTSNTDNNAGWTIKEKTFLFKAEKDIEKDEEIRTFYGYFLSEDGSTYDCDLVFGMAIDTFEGQHRIKSARFGSPNSFNLALQNANYMKMAQLLSASKDGLMIKKIVAVSNTMEEKLPTEIPISVSLNLLYKKIAEYKQSVFPMVKFYFEYTNKEGIQVSDSIVFKK